MRRYKIERSNISFYKDRKRMICTFTITHIKTREKHVFRNIYLALNNKNAFLVFPSTNEEVYINRERNLNNIVSEEFQQTLNKKLDDFNNLKN